MYTNKTSPFYWTKWIIGAKFHSQVDVFAAELTRRFALPIEKVDEALTSQAADEFGGRKARSANERKQQARTGERDSRAAAVLLQDFLNSRGLGS